ncbi:MAG: hypothetical protein K8R88_07900 [Armatimonadetes bacterium]|nr:hypothetical protein [Armatimonadota bacterium]
MNVSASEQTARNQIIADILAKIEAGETIKLPPFDRSKQMGSDFALQNVGVESNPFGATVGKFRYQFEAEEDLLHLFIVRQDGTEITVEDAQPVASFVLGPVPTAMIWLRPGVFSQHFYLGHEALTWIV